MNMVSKENCGVCGLPLIYGNESVNTTCAFCGKKFSANIYCPEGHYICDACHSRGALDILKDVLKRSDSADAFEILELVMSHPAVPMHGPEHHAILPAVLITAIKNAGYQVPENAVEKAIERGSKVPGGWCGFYGACGGGVGVGIAVSILTEATPVKGPERSLAMAATAYALGRITDNGPRCCKRMLRKGLQAAMDYLEKTLNITLVTDLKVKCRYVNRNRECTKEACLYY